ncbi:hypothetical protein PQI23_13625 [Leucobacter sp. USCH14]|uniref:hypothetical protein n=1 Tax=Leucobacter sp. USCH14 TaxID=3024838 RepID=UPI003096A3D8
MEIQIPAIPAGVLTLLAFFSPFAIALINHPTWPSGSKRIVSIVVSVVLAAIVLVLYFVMTGDVVPHWPVFVLLAIVVQQAAYALILKTSAKNIEGKYGAH